MSQFYSSLVGFSKLFAAIIITLIYSPFKAIYRWVVYCKTLPGDDTHFEADIVLVTGAACGIGRLIAENFARTGATVVLWDINADALEKAIEELRAQGHDVEGYVVDVSSRDQILDTYDKVKREKGQVTVLVNNAGIVIGKTFLEMSVEEFELANRVNLLSGIHLTKEVLPFMLDNNYGRIVNICSVVSYYGYNKLSEYCASKGGLRAFSEALQSELYFMNKTGISVTMICPYKINTGMFEGVQTRFPWMLQALEPKYVADRVYFAARNREFRVITPWIMHILVYLTYVLPPHSYKLMCEFFEIDKSMNNFVGHRKAS